MPLPCAREKAAASAIAKNLVFTCRLPYDFDHKFKNSLKLCQGQK
jgi:hypothetical protein